MKFIIRWLITAISLFVAQLLVPGITVEGDAWAAFAVTALILGLINATIRPILKALLWVHRPYAGPFCFRHQRCDFYAGFQYRTKLVWRWLLRG